MTDTAQSIGDMGAIASGPSLADMLELERSATVFGSAQLEMVRALFQLVVEKTVDGALSAGSLNLLVGARTVSVPESLPVGTPLIARALDATCVILQGTYLITYKGVSIGDDLSIAAGETVHLIVRASNTLEIT